MAREAVSPRIRAESPLRRQSAPFHDNEGGALQVLDKALAGGARCVERLDEGISGRLGAMEPKDPRPKISRPRLAGGRRMPRGGRVSVRRNVEALSGVVIRQRPRINQDPLIPNPRDR